MVLAWLPALEPASLSAKLAGIDVVMAKVARATDNAVE
jgi:hypothetical protein